MVELPKKSVAPRYAIAELTRDTPLEAAVIAAGMIELKDSITGRFVKSQADGKALRAVLENRDAFRQLFDWLDAELAPTGEVSFSTLIHRAPSLCSTAVHEEGYRLLSEGEIIQQGDQFWSSIRDCWKLSESVGSRFVGKLCYRRKLGAPAYRNLLPGEVLQKGDEYNTKGVWVSTADTGYVIAHPSIRYRRPLPDPGEGWRLLAPGETVKRGDEYSSNGIGWSLAERRQQVELTMEGKYRRRIPDPTHGMPPMGNRD